MTVVENESTAAAQPAAAVQPGTSESLVHRLIGPAAAAAVGVGIVALAQTIAEPTIATSFSPRWWPESVGAVIVVLSVVVAVLEVVRRTRSESDLEPSTRRGALRVASVLATILVYGVVWYYLDFRIATLLLLVALVAVLGGRGWKALVLFPVVVTGVLYVVFGLLLRVPL